MRDNPVTTEELDRAKKYTLGAHAIHQESGGSVLADMLDAWMFGSGLAELDEFEASISAVTPAGIQEIARRYFDPGKHVEGVVRGVGKVV